MNHLHFVQSLEPLQGGGLGQAALGMHVAMKAFSASALVTTRAEDFKEVHADVYQCVRKGPSPLYYSPELRRIGKKLVADAEWVHGHGFYVGPNQAIAGEAVKQGKSLCYHAHGFFDPWIFNRSRWKKRLAGVLFEDKNFKNVRLWRALTRKEADQIRGAGMKQTIEIMPNGIRLEEIDQPITDEQRLPFELRLRPKRALFLGRLHPKKGLDILIGAWASLSKKYPDWELAIVGPDEGGYLATVQALAKNMGVSDSIQFLGSVSGAAKIAAFRSSDLFVLSSYSEGFPMAVVEAAAHGLPCAITSECNFPELTEAGGAWESLPTKESFEVALEAALSADDLERKQRGERGRDLIEGYYTWPAIAKQMHEVCVAMS